MTVTEDGVVDGSDAYPLDPTASTNTDPTPTVPPIITLELPSNATLDSILPPLTNHEKSIA